MKFKCPQCGSTNVIFEADITIRFKCDENGKIMLVTEYADILGDLADGNGRKVVGVCEDCGLVFEENLS